MVENDEEIEVVELDEDGSKLYEVNEVLDIAGDVKVEEEEKDEVEEDGEETNEEDDLEGINDIFSATSEDKLK